MPFTTIQIVKKHLVDYRLGTKNIEDESIIIPTSDPVNLQFGNIREDSEKVKAKELSSPLIEEPTFNQNDQIILSHPELIYDTVVVASNSSMSVLYTENLDYSVDYNNGIITRIPSGQIPQLAEVTVWYLYYKIYSEGVDYKINYTNGEITRLETGELEPNQMLLVDYVSLYGNIVDEAISNAIDEANAKVLAMIDPAYQGSTDQALITAETYMTLAIISRIKAIEAAGRPENTASGYRGDFWLALSKSYAAEAIQLLEPYSRTMSTLMPPALAKSRTTAP
ncbi:MAG: hypothetical protein GF315_07045 [candidate division Zixibacteria bacterium]|nr:hypothetical protein [candidate division Zixibacteria bacterium]